MSHAVQGQPRWTGRGGEFWQNMVHWRSEWKTASVFLPWEPHDEYEKAKRWDAETWTPHIGRCLICCWKNNSRKKEEMEPTSVQPRQDPGGTLRMNGVGKRERINMRLALIGPSLCFTFWQPVLYPFTECFQGTRCLLMITQDLYYIILFFRKSRMFFAF